MVYISSWTQYEMMATQPFSLMNTHILKTRPCRGDTHLFVLPLAKPLAVIDPSSHRFLEGSLPLGLSSQHSDAINCYILN